MLKHTEDLIRTDMVPPNQRSARARALHNKTKFSSTTAFSKKNNKNKNHKRGAGGKGVKANKPRLARPFLDNDDSFPLAPQLAALWEANHYRILGKPRPFRLQQVEQEQEEQQVEQARAAGDGDSVTSQPDMPMPDDEDEDYPIPVWAGILPVETRLGDLVDDDRLLPDVAPSDAVKSLQGRSI